MSNEGVKRTVDQCAAFVRGEAGTARSVRATMDLSPYIPHERVVKLQRRVVLLNNINYWLSKAQEDVERLIAETGGE
jgi:hypothetical protein